MYSCCSRCWGHISSPFSLATVKSHLLLSAWDGFEGSLGRARENQPNFWPAEAARSSLHWPACSYPGSFQLAISPSLNPEKMQHLSSAKTSGEPQSVTFQDNLSWYRAHPASFSDSSCVQHLMLCCLSLKESWSLPTLPF